MDPIAIIEEVWAWLIALPPDFAFLLSLPLLVGLAGLLTELGRSGRSETGAARMDAGAPAPREKVTQIE